MYGPDFDAIYKRIITGKDFESYDFVAKWFERIFNKITEILEKNYKADKLTHSEEDIPAFNLKNWLRQKVAFEDFQDNFKRLIKGDYEMGGLIACQVRGSLVTRSGNKRLGGTI